LQGRVSVSDWAVAALPREAQSDRFLHTFAQLFVLDRRGDRLGQFGLLRRHRDRRLGRGPRWPPALADLPDGLGPRAAAICRELTKLHEEIRRGDLVSLARHYETGAETRGEIVIVVAPPAEDAGTADDVDNLLRRALARVSVKDAVGEVALATGRPRREVYQRALALADSSGEKDGGNGAA